MRKNRVLVEVLVERGVEVHGGAQVVPERLLGDDARAAGGESGRGEHADEGLHR